MRYLKSIVAIAMGSLLLGANSPARSQFELFTSLCAGCHNPLQHPKALVYNAAGNVAIIEAVNALGMGAQGSLDDHTSIAAYLDTVKPTITLAPVAHDSPGTVIALGDIIVSAAEEHAYLKIIDTIATVSPPTKGTVTYQWANGPGQPSLVTYTPFPGQSGIDTWTYQGSGAGLTTTIRTASVMIAAGEPVPPGMAVAVEYYYAAWDYYFETAFLDEIAALDAGAFGGVWKRTGETFNVWSQPDASASPTCRFFSTTFAPKSSHFYTPFPAECAVVKTNPNWEYESIAFYMQLAVNGTCSPGTIPLYRFYNNGMGGAPNHRYTTSLTIFNQMTALGWQFEGDQTTKVFACVPQ